MKHIKSISAGTITALALSIVFFSSTDAMAQSRRYEGWHMVPGMMGGWGMGWFGGIFMMIFWVLILVGLFFLINWLIQSTNRAKSDPGNGSRAMEVLKERYARGDLDKVEFETMKLDLSK